MDGFKGNFTAKPHLSWENRRFPEKKKNRKTQSSWENRWFPLDFPLKQSIDAPIRPHRPRWAPRTSRAADVPRCHRVPCPAAVGPRQAGPAAELSEDDCHD